MLELSAPPLDSCVLANVLTSYKGETLQVRECAAPVYHGKGIAAFKTGFTYTGDFCYGRMHGKGRIVWHARGVVYEGDVTHNEISGQGTYWWPDGSSYIGDVKEGKRHGHGVLKTETRGVSLQHAMQEDKIATNRLPAGDTEDSRKGHLDVPLSTARYSGEWQDGVPHGDGELVFDEGRHVRYCGQFVAGKREGSGAMHYADKSVYVGDWKADVKCGHGLMTWVTPDSGTDSETKIPLEMYDGEWVDDCQQGVGRHVWYQRSADTSSIRIKNDKNWYEGEFNEGRRHGRGVFFYANGARYEGEWKMNVKDGYGLFFYEDGRVFVGLYRQDRSVQGSFVTAASAEIITRDSVMESAVLSPPSSFRDGDGVMLYIDDLLPFTDTSKRDKARKAVGHAVMRLNSELRALNRECIQESRQSLAFERIDSDDLGHLLDLVECRQLLSRCGFYLTSKRLERFLYDVRTAQRAKALAGASSMNIAEHFKTDVRTKSIGKSTFDRSRLKVVPYDETVLFREFVELLVRIASSWVQTAEADGLIELSGCSDSPEFLANVFSQLYDQMMNERHRTQIENPPTWLTLLRIELTSKTLFSTFTKHHDHLQFLYDSCAAPVVQQQNLFEQEIGKEIENAPLDTCKGDVSVRSVLAMLSDGSRVSTPVFTPELPLSDALAALNRAFAPSFPPVPVESLKIKSSLQNIHDTEPDAFFIGRKLVFSEFRDAIATVLFVKEHLARKQLGSEVQKAPLYALVNRFMQSEIDKSYTVV